MQRKVGHAVYDMLEAIERIEQVTNRKTLEDFNADWQLQWLAHRAIEIISEASRAIPDDLKNTRPEIPWARVRAIGNIMRHEYDGLSGQIVWNVIVHEFPRLKAALSAIRAELKE
jgi:uncharacterized protein with HEPN domain